MKIPDDLLAILVCPETHQPLHAAPDALLAKLQALQKEGRLLNRAGKPVADPPEAALVREDGKVAYLVVEEIPVMLIEEGVMLEQTGG